MYKKLNLKITLDKPSFYNNEVISGIIHLESLENLKTNKLTLVLTKNFNYEYDSERQDPYIQLIKNQMEIYKKKLLLYEAKKRLNELGSGYHQFPFSISLNSTNNGSSTFSQYMNNTFISFQNEYKLEAFLDIQNDNVYKDEKILNIMSDLKVIKKITDTINIMSCLCLQSTNILIIGYADKEFYFTEDILNFTVRLSNSTFRIKRMKLRLVCHIKLKNRQNKIYKTKIIGFNDESVIKEDECESSIKTPSNIPSTTEESYLNVFYILEGMIYINRGSPVRIKRNIKIYKKNKINEKYLPIGAMKGIFFPRKYLQID